MPYTTLRERCYESTTDGQLDYLDFELNTRGDDIFDARIFPHTSSMRPLSFVVDYIDDMKISE